MNRRQFIKTSIAAAAATAGLTQAALAGDASRQKALEDLRKYDLIFPRVMFRNDKRMRDKWNILPCGENNLLMEFKKVVRCRVKTIPGLPKFSNEQNANNFNALVSFEDYDTIRQYPLVFMTSDGYFLFDENEKKNLKKYINQGGFILMDDCVFNQGGDHCDYFFKSGMKVMTELFGVDAIKKIPLDHELYHNVYDRGDKGWAFIQGINHGAYGLFTEGRIAAIISPTDIHCGWADKDHGFYGPNGKSPAHDNHERAIEMGINMLMYAMSH